MRLDRFRRLRSLWHRAARSISGHLIVNEPAEKATEMARYRWFKQITKSTGVSLLVAWLVPFLVLGTPAVRSQSSTAQAGASVGMCEFIAQAKYYVSAIFDAANDHDRSKWEVEWADYIHKQVDPFPGNSYCRFFRSRASAQQTLQIQKNQVGAAKVIETGWVYTPQ